MKSLKLSILGVAASVMLAFGGVQAQASEAPQAKAANAKSELVHEVKAGEKIASNPKVLTIIDFNATWCGPCRQFKPIFDKMAKEYKGKVKFLSVDVDNCPELAKQFEVTAIPQITAIKPDGTKKTQVGFMNEEQFKAFIEAALK